MVTRKAAVVLMILICSITQLQLVTGRTDDQQLTVEGC